jgi:predicted glycoside hydrolase/deacetylase ChbG (UPF0249 family)
MAMVNRGALPPAQVSKLIELYATRQISLGLHLEIEGRDVLKQCFEQWEKFVKATGMVPDYVDIHKDHFFKSDYDTIAGFCMLQNVSFRKYRETTVHVTGPDNTLIASYMDLEDILNHLNIVKQGECHEIVFHIGVFDEDVSSALNKEREADLVKLKSVRRKMDDKGIELINYKMIRNA